MEQKWRENKIANIGGKEGEREVDEAANLQSKK